MWPLYPKFWESGPFKRIFKINDNNTGISCDGNAVFIRDPYLTYYFNEKYNALLAGPSDGIIKTKSKEIMTGLSRFLTNPNFANVTNQNAINIDRLINESPQ
jgi:hypothetical protein